MEMVASWTQYLIGLAPLRSRLAFNSGKKEPSTYGYREHDHQNQICCWMMMNGGDDDCSSIQLERFGGPVEH